MKLEEHDKIYVKNPFTNNYVEIYPAMAYDMSEEDKKIVEDNDDEWAYMTFEDAIRCALRCISLSLIPEITIEDVLHSNDGWFEVYRNPMFVNGEVWMPIDTGRPNFMVRKWKPNHESLVRLMKVFGNDVTHWKESDDINSFGEVVIKLQIENGIINAYPEGHIVDQPNDAGHLDEHSSS